MLKKMNDNNMIYIFLTEEDSYLSQYPAGSNFIHGDCDPFLKQIYLQQNLTDVDVLAFNSGEITPNLQQTLDDIYLPVTDIDMHYSHELRKNLFRILQ